MLVFFAYIKTSFKKNLTYRINSFLGIINILVQIIISCEIWKALYAGEKMVNGISYPVVVTNFILTLGISNILTVDDFFIQYHINKGTIACELLRPMDLRKRILAENIGGMLYKFLVNFIPATIIALCFVKITLPASGFRFVLFIISICLGVGILWSISLIVQMTSFWIINVWSVSTIKNVIINLLSGAVIPVWFMPHVLQKVVKVTPFEAIYYIPMQIYLGKIKLYRIGFCYVKQICWIVIFCLIGSFMWEKGKKRIITQGG